MSECNSIVCCGEYMVVFQCQGKLKGRKWCYNVIHVGGGPGKVPVPKPVGLQSNGSLSVIIPLCKNIKPWQVICRTVSCADLLCTKVGTFDGIYGIRFDIANPHSNFTVCFCTPKRKPENQPMGLIVNGVFDTCDEICSPGCKRGIFCY